MNQHQGAGGPADDARPQDLELYAALLTFTKQRLLYADEKLAKPPRHRVELEECALQVRAHLAPTRPPGGGLPPGPPPRADHNRWTGTPLIGVVDG